MRIFLQLLQVCDCGGATFCTICHGKQMQQLAIPVERIELDEKGYIKLKVPSFASGIPDTDTGETQGNGGPIPPIDPGVHQN